MHYQLFIPHKFAANPQHLHDAGLGALLRDEDRKPNFSDVANGPENLPGLMVSWGNPVPASDPAWIWEASGFDPATRQTDAFWFGRNAIEPCTPADISRSKGYLGFEITLDDGHNWLLPVVSQLPHRLVIDRQTGNWERQLKQGWQWLYDLSTSTMQKVLAAIDDDRQFTFADVEPFLVASLSINYRLCRPLLPWFPLFSDENWVNVVMQLLDLQRITAAIERRQKKTV